MNDTPDPMVIAVKLVCANAEAPTTTTLFGITKCEERLVQE
jgi:hypothetical protein